MGNICGTSGSRHVYSPSHTQRITSAPSTSTHVGGDTLTSIHQLSHSQREQFLNMHDPMRVMGLDHDTELFRTTDSRYIKNDKLAGNPQSMASILMHEELRPNPFASHTGAQPHEARAYVPKRIKATDLGVPSLNVMTGSLARDGIRAYDHMSDNQVSVKMRLGDFLERGGKVYADASSIADDGDTSQALIVTLPKGQKVPVERV
ncbi:AvrPphF-ORF-2 [Pseudomonas syringae]|uniref:HopF n=1 Tax=Pseudomonas syringae pv. apii TaxID=81036 RepID=A0A3M3NDV8_9PSED|nr:MULTISPECIES: type III secretion system effector HopF2 [Pseudomonas syringae group]RMN53962.1 HopF [Pseudomonas syringae pv. apii]RMN57908.1 HopF [Pseudomonas syringae pv. apii]RMN93581.1 HopF [Pseudomonas syringae pv. apii]SDY63266.1 AvrPphF-ORF-2 [Pseudomonas syringae]